MGRPQKCEYRPKPIKGFIPVEIDLDRFEKTEPMEGLLKDGFKYILMYMTGYKRKTNTKQKNPGIPISSTELRSALSIEYHKYMKYLLEKEIIIKVKRHSSRKLSSRYEFPEWYSGKVKDAIVKNREICIREQRRLARNKLIVSNRYPYLTKWFNENLRFDFISYLLNHGIVPTTEKNKFGYACEQTACIKLRDQAYSLKCDDYSGRLHSNLTNLKKKLRNYITYGNFQLVSIDLKNSQLYFLSYLLKLLANENSTSIFATILKYSNKTKRVQIAKILTELGVLHNLDDDAIKFSQISSSGEIYEHFGKLLQSSNFLKDERTVIDRKYAKKLLIHFLFSRVKSTHKNMIAIRPIFQAEWPSLFLFLQRIKVDSKVLPLVLQSIERHFILDIIAKEFSLAHPDAPLFSIHDSLITSEPYADKLYTMFEKRLHELTGLMPTLDKEYWDQRNL